MNIVIVGHVCIDENNSEHATYNGAGSPAMFMQKIFQQLPETHVTIVSPYGSDYAQYLKGIEIFPKKPTGATTLLYKNISHGNDRTQKALNRNNAMPVALDSELKNILNEADICIVCPLLPNFSPKYAQALAQSLPDEAITLLMPQGYFRCFDASDRVRPREFSEAKALLPFFHFVTLSSEDYPGVEKLSRLWVDSLSTTIVMTQGNKGAKIITRKGEKEITTDPIPLDQIVDSVGSGDIFSAGFIYEYAKMKDVEGAVRFANKLAGACLAFTPEHIHFDYSKLHTT